MDSKSEYNKAAQGYENATKRPLRRFVYDYTIMKLIGSVKGKRVLDLACGEGVSSRMMKALGAGEVIGLDISDQLIRKAKKHRSAGIHYHVADIFDTDLSSFGEFEIVTAIMAVHYSNSKKKLESLFSRINGAMLRCSTFYALTVNPSILSTGYSKYGVKISRAEKEGQIVNVTLHDFEWNKYCEFTNVFWEKKTYKKLLIENGFSVKWIDSIVDPEALNIYSHSFWQEYLKQPIYQLIMAKKI